MTDRRGQPVPGVLLADFATLDGQTRADRLMAISPPGRQPAVPAAQEGRDGHQFDRLGQQLLVILRVPAVAAHQYPKPPSRCLQHLQRLVHTRVDEAPVLAVWIVLALGLAQDGAVAGEYHAAVEQRAAPGVQCTFADVGLRQHDRAGYQGYAEFLGQAAEHLLVIGGHLIGLHAQMGIGPSVIALGREHGPAIAKRVAQFEPLQRFTLPGHLVQRVLLATCPQPGADVLRQYHHSARRDQAQRARLLKVGGKLAVQALQVLVVPWVQQRLDAQQVALLAGLPVVDCQLDAQVGQVVPLRALLGPEGVTTQGGDHYQQQGTCQKFFHETGEGNGYEGILG